ncbi:MAG TPA: PAS domain-containing protein [Microvirga sp.]|jgi:PAS domain S-box-containing protein|nr:PAS domain-containing protein [Microvirga sp.]
MSEKSRAPDLGSAREIEEGLGDPFTAAFRATRMAMVITDPRRDDNPIIFVNDAFLNLTGYAQDEVVGRNCRFLQGPDTDPAAIDAVRAAVAAGEDVEVELLNHRKDGSPFWNALVISPVRNEEGDLLYFFASQADISAKKQAEQDLNRSRDILEDLVAQRTRDLQEALDQTSALLHEVDHRVKNNLQVVSSLVLLKARQSPDEATRRVLLNMAERISALSTVHRLLYPAGDVSRFDLKEFIGDLTADLMTALPKDRITLDLDVAPVTISAAKATPLALLVNEIVGNALKHAYPDGSRGRVAVRVAKLDGDVCIVIEDGGIGLEAQGASGRGFGKTLIEMLVRQLRARIDWEDAQPGTRAVVTVPLNAEEAQL